MARIIFRIVLVSLGVFSLARVVLYGAYRSTVFAHLDLLAVARGFLYGLRFDASAAMVFLAVPLVMLACRVPSGWQDAWRLAWGWGAFVLLSLMAYVLGGDAIYFRFVHRHMFDELTMLGQDTAFIGKSVAVTYGAYTLAVTLALGALGLIWHRIVLAPPKEARSRRSEVLARVGLILAIALAIRGSVGLKPIGTVDAFTAASAEEGHLTLNGVFTAARASIGHEDAVPIIDVTPNERAAVLRRFGYDPLAPFPFMRSQVTAPLRFSRRPNIIVILVESLGAHYVDSFGGQGYRVTPNMDALAARSLRFSHFFANGSRSIEGIQAVLTAFPALRGLPTLGQGFEQLKVARLGSIMKKHGYATMFYQSSDRRSFRLDAVAAATGFEEYYGQEDYPRLLDYGKASAPQFGWDYEPLMHMLKRVGKGPTPFLTFLFTGTTHTPFALPPTPVPRPDHGEDNEAGYLDTIAYTDWCLGEFFASAAKQDWFQDTVFLITGDHTFPAYRTFDFIDHYRVPLLIYAPNILGDGERPLVGSHLDLVPTILDLAGIEEPVAAAGGSMLRTAGEGVALLGGRFGTPALISADGYVSHTLEKRLEEKSLNPVCDSACLTALERALLVLTEEFRNSIRRNHWSE